MRRLLARRRDRLLLFAVAAWGALFVVTRSRPSPTGTATVLRAAEAVEALRQAVKSFVLCHRRLPCGLAELTVPDETGRSCVVEVPCDSWGHAFVVRGTAAPGKWDWVVLSVGPDGEEGTDNDIMSRAARSR